MSTRCNIHFTYGDDVCANVYRHSDGYPDGKHGVPADLEKFFKAVEKETTDHRFDDPEYLAAKFIVWQAGEYSGEPGSLDFISLGVCTEDHGDVAYIYTVDCKTKKRPKVSWKSMYS